MGASEDPAWGSKPVELARAVAAIRGLQDEARPVLVGVEGYGGSGKSTFADQLCDALGDADVVRVDDFIVKDRLADTPWDEGAFDHVRLERQVLSPAGAGKGIAYQKLIWETGGLGEMITVPRVGFVIVEGFGEQAGGFLWCHVVGGPSTARCGHQRCTNAGRAASPVGDSLSSCQQQPGHRSKEHASDPPLALQMAQSTRAARIQSLVHTGKLYLPRPRPGGRRERPTTLPGLHVAHQSTEHTRPERPELCFAVLSFRKLRSRPGTTRCSWSTGTPSFRCGPTTSSTRTRTRRSQCGAPPVSAHLPRTDPRGTIHPDKVIRSGDAQRSTGAPGVRTVSGVQPIRVAHDRRVLVELHRQLPLFRLDTP